MDKEHVNCSEAVETLYHYLDGELTATRRVEIRQHLDDCPPCFEAFDFEAELRVLISTKCRDHVPEGLRDRIAETLRQMSQPGGGIPTL